MTTDVYNKLIDFISKDSNGEPTLALKVGCKVQIRAIGWPVHYLINKTTYERLDSIYEKWNFRFQPFPSVSFSASSRNAFHMCACWVLDRKDGNCKIMDFFGDTLLKAFRDFRNNSHLDPGGEHGPDFLISIEEPSSPIHWGHKWTELNSSPFSTIQMDVFRKAKLKDRLYAARRQHTQEQQKHLLAGNYLQFYGLSAATEEATDRLTKILEDLYDFSKNPQSIEAKQKLLVEYSKITGKKFPGFMRP